MSINEVAKLAGVSSSTVSRVINNHPRVAPETVENVKKAMRQLSYTPSDRRPGPKPAGRLRTGTSTVAFLVFGTSGSSAAPAFERLLRGVSEGASRHDIHLAFNYVPDPEHVPSRVFDERVQGVLLHGTMPGASVRDKLRRLPTVWLMGNRRRPDWGDQVLPDGFAVGEYAAKYLIDRGHENLAFLNLDAAHWSLRMYGHAFASAASSFNNQVQVHRLEQVRDPQGDYWHADSLDAVNRLVQQYLALSPRPTGLFVAEDMQIAMLQPALQKAGVEIAPGKVEIISCNNEQPYRMGLAPAPAAIDIRAESIGQRAIEQLLWRIEHTDVPERIITTVEPAVTVPQEST